MEPQPPDRAPPCARRSFFYRNRRGCTREDVHTVARSIGAKAELDGAAADALEELLYELCSRGRTSVLIEVGS